MWPWFFLKAHIDELLVHALVHSLKMVSYEPDYHEVRNRKSVIMTKNKMCPGHKIFYVTPISLLRIICSTLGKNFLDP